MQRRLISVQWGFLADSQGLGEPELNAELDSKQTYQVQIF